VSPAGALWRAAATLAAPALPLWLARRARRGKEFPARLPERRGIARLPRPAGRLLWLHAASVGETQSVLPLIARLRESRPDLAVLLTTATVTAARLIGDRLGERAADPERSGLLPGHPWLIHQFAPLDVPAWISRFLDHWRPDAAGFVESELWPNALTALRTRAIPVALINARLSARSFARWRLAPGLARRLLRAFALVLPQSAGDAERLARLGATVSPPGNLKLATPPLPADETERARLAALFGADPVWVAASTHAGEETQVLAAHRLALAAVPALRLILAPRHPERGAEVAETAAAAGFAAGRRSAGEDPDGPVWIADTLGELGLWYRLGLGAYVGGSLIPRGGQNPLEPARLGLPVAFGPDMGNFAEIATMLRAAGAASEVADAAALAAWAVRLVREPAWRAEAGRAAATAAATHAMVLDRMAEGLLGLLPAGEHTEG
jgi:3-deoxy-D-manno-octulosonic-acid transferase